jgi:3-deoxy-D-manno-octulosonate 8-phosphate phosphatase KdsC-like HAD superfamily phosphatase
MGDDLPDIHIMESSAIAACPENAVPEVKEFPIIFLRKKEEAVQYVMSLNR